MASYILRTIDPELWERVKARSTEDDLPLRRVILALLEMYASGKIKIATAAKKA